MYFVVSAAAVLVGVVVIYRLLARGAEPDFTLKSPLDQNALKLAVIALASRCVSPVLHGRGIDAKYIQKYADKYYGRIALRAQNGRCFEFENRIYDSFFLLREKIAYLKKQTKNLGNLPHCGKYPRVYQFCRLLVHSTGGAVSGALLTKMVDEYNEITPLSQFEIAALPACLDFALAEFLAIYCDKSNEISKFRAVAERDAAKKRIDLSCLNEGAYTYFYLLNCDYESEASLCRLAALNDISVKLKNEKFGLLVSSYSAAVESAVSTLREAKMWLTDEYILRLSPINRLLEGEDIVYKNCTLPTKNVYLHFIARRAKRQRKGELALAREIVTAAKSKGEDIARFILPRAGGAGAQRLYIFAVLTFATLFCSGIGATFALFLDVLWVGITLAVLFFPSAVAIVLTVVGELNSRAVFRRYLPRLNISDSKALLIFCGLAGSKKEIQELFFNLRTLRYASPNANFRYGLLLDFPAGEETCDADAELFAECRRLFGLLKEDKYNLYVRRRRRIDEGIRGRKREEGVNGRIYRRRKSDGETRQKGGAGGIHGNDKAIKGKFQGWEKKRGALINLNEYLLTAEDAEFSLVLGRRVCPKYVVTLDCDTMLNCAEELVEIMDHPFNSEKTIISVKAKTNPYTISTAFARLLCGAVGLDGYSFLAAEANYDLFDSGNYTGKGIYRLGEYNKKLKGFFPDGRILSHDFIEGAVAGCGSAECALDTYPANFSQYLTRSIRWLRGDWQLLPYLFGRVMDKGGNKIKNPISSIAKWHIFCNLLFSLLPVFALAGVFVSIFSAVGVWAVSVSLGYYVFVVLNTVRNSVLHGTNPLPEFFKTAFNVATLPIIAVYNLCAILMTLFRLAANRKLLEWKTFAHAKGRASVLPCVFAAVLIIGISWYFGNLIIMFIIGSLFMSGIILIFVLNHEYRSKNYLPDFARIKLKETARKTWGYFKDSAVVAGYCLIPDNFQEYLNKGFADRTSPTNIGFSLISSVCAFSLGFIDVRECEKMLEETVAKIEALPKWRGNLYNWMDIKGGLLYPKYVSSVDNGNLLASLLVLESFCEDEFEDKVGRESDTKNPNKSEKKSHIESLSLTLKKRVRGLIDGMDLSSLYDKKRGLLHIGYNESYKTFDGHYDLMASESMLTYLTAIGCGKIPKKSFENLSKNALKSYGKVALSSWTGGVFEYLMSALFVRYPHGGMLDRGAKAAINAHVRFAQKKKLPFWGFSESQYNHTDNNGNYQYRAFGVPSIANSNQEGGEAIAVYASILALSFVPKKVLQNLDKIEEAGLNGRYGYYEAYDKGVHGGDDNKGNLRGKRKMSERSERLKNRDKGREKRHGIRAEGVVVQSFMAHHQGMILAAVCNYLSDNILIKKLRSTPSVRAAELLLTQTEFHAVSKKKKPLPPRLNDSCNEITVKKTYPLKYNILDGDKYSVLYDSAGGSCSVYKGKSVSRYEAGQGGFKTYFADITEMVQNAENQQIWECSLEKPTVYVRHSTEKPQNTKVNHYCDSVIFDDSARFSELYKYSNPQGTESTENFDNSENLGNVISFGKPDSESLGGDDGLPFDRKKSFCAYKTLSEVAADFAYSPSRENGSTLEKNGGVFGDGLYWHDISSGAALFSDHKTEYEYKTEDFLIRQVALVLPNLSGEGRRVRIKNLSDKVKFFALKTRILPAMTEKSRDLSHKLFSSMKIRTEILEGMLVCYRNDEDKMYLAHYFDCEGVRFESGEYNLRSNPDMNEITTKPQSIANNAKTSMPSFGAPLYPALSGEKVFRLRPGEKADFCVYNLLAEDKDTLARAAGLTRSPAYFKQALTAAFSQSKIEGLSRRACDLLSALTSPRRLFAHEFGTRPLVVLEAGETPELLYQQLCELRTLQKFATFTVAVIYKEVPGYFNKTFDKINYYIEKSGLKNAHTVNRFLGEKRCAALRAAAVLPAVFNKIDTVKVLPPLYKNVLLSLPEYDLGGAGAFGFLADSSFFIEVRSGGKLDDIGVGLLRPWSNVIGSDGIGTTVTESGGGYTFYKNSAINKITHWSNDPLHDKPSEGVIFEEAGVVWSATKNPAGRDSGYYCRHGFGWTQFKCNFNGMVVTQTEFIDMKNCKYKLLKLKNCERDKRKIDVCVFMNLVMGDSRENTTGHLSIKDIDGGLRVENRLNGSAMQCVTNGKIRYYVRHKQQVFVSEGGQNMEKHTNSDSTTNIDFDQILDEPSAALTVEVDLTPYSEKEIVFCIRAEDSSATAKIYTPDNLSNKNNNNADDNYVGTENLLQTAKAALKNSAAYFFGLSDITIKTGDKSLDHLLNWLPYQTLSCRFFARAALYQAGGAIGFRDQLQDCLALLYVSPTLVRNHILDCAAHQFEEGDVMHWWHPPMTGVRTRVTDDMLYLPWVTAEYIKFTGDVKILGESVPFLCGRTLKEDERDLYFTPTTGEFATLYEHCLRAIKRNKIADNNLIFMGGGDWNDAMDNVGIKGKGTTVWGSMFLYHVIDRFMPYVKNAAQRKEFMQTALRLKNGVETAWDGEWFLRAFMDDGTILGSKNSRECQIDLLSQSWASLSGIADKKHAKTALKSAADRLIDYENGVIKLLDPPFEHIDAGYIAGYPKGVRENGGQYTHAAVWFVMALLKEGSVNFAYSLFEMLNPANRYKGWGASNGAVGAMAGKGAKDRYMAEPYALCGDVYAGEFAGVAGWSWYTGAAGWYYKCFIENFCGISIQNGRMAINPKLPDKLRRVEVKYKTCFGVLDIIIDNMGIGENRAIFVDKVRYNVAYILLTPALLGKKIVVKRVE